MTNLSSGITADPVDHGLAVESADTDRPPTVFGRGVAADFVGQRHEHGVAVENGGCGEKRLHEEKRWPKRIQSLGGGGFGKNERRSRASGLVCFRPYGRFAERSVFSGFICRRGIGSVVLHRHVGFTSLRRLFLCRGLQDCPAKARG